MKSVDTMSDTPRTDAACKDFTCPEDGADLHELCQQLERELADAIGRLSKAVEERGELLATISEAENALLHIDGDERASAALARCRDALAQVVAGELSAAMGRVASSIIENSQSMTNEQHRAANALMPGSSASAEHSASETGPVPVAGPTDYARGFDAGLETAAGIIRSPLLCKSTTLNELAKEILAMKGATVGATPKKDSPL